MTSHYHMIHTGLSNRKAGILVMIHKSLVSSSSIRITAPIPGRLILVRLETSPAICIIGTYQHVWSEVKGAVECEAEREVFWTRLNELVRGTPWRCQLVLAGDFNTPCQEQAPHVGTGLASVTGAVRQKDQHRLQQLIVSHNLVALNTWGRRSYSHTYQFDHAGGQHRTQIDFILCRAHHGDPLAKGARTIRAPFVPDKGMRHFPILASLPKPQPPRQSRAGQSSVGAKEVMQHLQGQPDLAVGLVRQLWALRRQRFGISLQVAPLLCLR
ncbi:unnamed protein product, partial [Symbiodinium necroappetens]